MFVSLVLALFLYFKLPQNIHIKSDKTYSVRDGLIDSNYYIQSQKSKVSLEYIPRLSSDFYQYILHFII